MGDNRDIFQIVSYFFRTNDNVPTGSFLTQHISFSLTPGKAYDAVIVGVPDIEGSCDYKCANQIRSELYKLSALSKNFNILDLGNLKCSNNIQENIDALYKVIDVLHKQSLKIILLGGSAHFLNKVIYNYYRAEQIPLNLVEVNSLINWEHLPVEPITADPLNSIQQNQLSFVNIGYQLYFVEKEILDFLHDANFEVYRLGMVRNNISNFEPILRDANMLNISLNAVKYADSPASKHSSPNGLSGDEICQLAFYGGYSSRLKMFNITDINTSDDPRNITTLLAAQSLWYLFEGFTNNMYEDPGIAPENFTKYHIHIDIANQDLAFYYSNLTQRWWMEVSLDKNKRKILLSCTLNDYELACKQEIPERWWRLFDRLEE